MKKLHIVLALAISFSLMIGFSNAISLEAVMPIINGWSASEASNGVKVVKDGSNYYVCNSGNLSNCNKKNASLWVKYEKGMNRSDRYYICNATSSSCGIMSYKEVIYQHHETMEFDGYYICSSSSCNFTDSNTKINKDSGGSSYDTSYYVCQGEKYKCLKNNASYKYSITTDKIFRCNASASSCYSSNATSTITKKSAPSGGNSSSSSSSSSTDFSWLVADIEAELADFNKATNYYNKGLNAALNDDYETAIKNQIEVVKIYKSLYKSNSKDYKDLLANSYSNLGYYFCLDEDYTNSEKAYEASLNLVNDSSVRKEYESCKKDNNTKSCTSVFGSNSFLADDGLCYCKNGYTWNKEETSCVTLDESCRSYFGDHSIGDPTDLDNCLCEDGYEFNSDGSKCIKSSNNTNVVINNTNNGSNRSYNNEYSDEYNRAYEYAFANKITTMPTIEQANMHGYITRAEISKMFSEWALKHGATIDTSKSCKFNDIASVKGDLHDYIIKSCQLGIMGQGIKNFRPYDTISRAEVFTVISRILRGSTYEGCDPYYSCHESAIASAGIYSDMRESDRIQELRGNVMMYLMRGDGVGKSNSSYDDVIEYNDTIIDNVLICDDSVVNELLDKDEYDISELKNAVSNTIKSCKNSYGKLNELGDRKGDNSLINTAQEFIAIKYAFYLEYEKIIPYLGRELSTKEDKEYTELYEKIQKLDKKLSDINDKLINTQNTFAKKFGYDLED